jgi:hypothetical protein
VNSITGGSAEGTAETPECGDHNDLDHNDEDISDCHAVIVGLGFVWYVGHGVLSGWRGAHLGEIIDAHITLNRKGGRHRRLDMPAYSHGLSGLDGVSEPLRAEADVAHSVQSAAS